MRITIEGTDRLVGYSVEVAIPNDHGDVTEVMDLVKQVLLAWGFQPQNLADYFEGPETDDKNAL